MITGMDRNVYLYTISDSTAFNYNNIEYISRINDTTGTVAWTKKLTDYKLDESYLRISDYSPTELLFSSYKTSGRIFRINKMSKADGNTLATIEVPVGDPNFQSPYGYETTTMYAAANKNLFLFTADSVYKLTSFENPTVEWKTALWPNKYGDIRNAWENNGVLYIAGTKNYGFESGVISAFNISTGTLTWQQVITPSMDMNFREAKIVGNKLFSTWQPRYSGSILEKSFVSCRDVLTGNLIWERNYEYTNDTTLPYVPHEQGMMSLDVDNNSRVYVTGYVPNPVDYNKDWGTMKIRGSDSIVLARRRMPQLVQAQYAEDEGIMVRYLNGKLYEVGNRSTSGNMLDNRIDFVQMDTASLGINNIKRLTPSLQYPSVVTGIRDFSAGKRIMIKNIGRSLVAEMTDRNMNTIWKKQLGAAPDLYVCNNVMTVSLSKRIFIAAERYKAGNNHMLNEFKDALGNSNNDSTFIFELDSTGTLVKTYRYLDNSLLTPLKLAVDTASGKTFFQYDYSYESYCYSFATADGTWGNSVVANRAGRVPFMAPRNFYMLTNDTLVGFKTAASAVSVMVKLKQFVVGGAPYVFTNIKNVRFIYDVDKGSTPASFYMVGQDSLKNDFVARMNSNNAVFTWRNTYDTLQNTIKVFQLDTSLYTLTLRNRLYSINKYNVSTGSSVWTKTVTLPANQMLTVNDFTVNKLRRTISLTGSVRDTTDLPNHTLAFALTMDTTGTELTRAIRDGDRPWLNEGKFLYADKDGLTLNMGRINYSTYNYAGFIGEINASSPTNDLLFQSVSVAPALVTPPANITATFTEANAGSDIAPAHKIRFYLSADATLTPGTNGDLLLGSYDMNQLLSSAANSGVINVPLAIPCTVVAGNYYVFFVADADNQVTETNELNNSSFVALTIQAGAGAPVPVITANPGTTACTGTPVTLTATAPGCSSCSYSWSNGASGASISITTAGVYTVTVSNSCGSGNTNTTVSFNPSPSLTVSANNTTICLGDTVTLNVSGAANYTWTGMGLLSTSGSTVKAVPTSAGMLAYSVSGSNSNCSSSATININVIAKPVFNITPGDTSICSGQNITLQAIGTAGSYSWSPATGLNTTTGSVVIASPTSNIIYTVTANTSGCTSQKTRTISVNPSVTPSVTVSTSGCPGNTIVFTASPVGAGSVPNYVWYVNNLVTWVGNPFTLSGAVNGTQVYVKMVPYVQCSTLPVVTSATTTVNCITTALPSLTGVEEFSVSPNPGRGIYVLKFNVTGAKKINYCVRNADGVKVFNAPSIFVSGAITRTIDISSLAAGVYYLEMISGNERSVFKIVLVR
jgi:hypothetical protein